jgi:hypothetical protein
MLDGMYNNNLSSQQARQSTGEYSSLLFEDRAHDQGKVRQAVKNSSKQPRLSKMKYEVICRSKGLAELF